MELTLQNLEKALKNPEKLFWIFSGYPEHYKHSM